MRESTKEETKSRHGGTEKNEAKSKIGDAKKAALSTV